MTAHDSDLVADILSRLPQVVFLADLETRAIVYISPLFEAVVGIAPQALQSRSDAWRSLVPRETVADVDRLLALARTDAIDGDIRVPHPVKGPRVLRVRTWAAARGPAGEFRVAGSCEDVTEARQAAAREALAQKTFRDLIECLPVGVLVYRGGRAVYCNQTLVDYVGVPREEIVGEQVTALIERVFVVDERAQGLERLRQAVAGGVLPPVERRIRRADGELRIAEMTTLTVTFGGEPSQVTILHDLTQHRAIAARLAATDRMATLGRIAAGLAHELNNPLAFVLGSLELAAEHLEPVSAGMTAIRGAIAGDAADADALAHHVAAVGNLMQSAAHGARSVREVMTDFRSVSMPPAAVSRRLALHVPLRSALRLARHQLEPCATLSHVFDETVEVVGDSARIGQAFLHLLMDIADQLRATPGGPHPLRLTIGGGGEAAVVSLRAPVASRIDELGTPGAAFAGSPGVLACSEALAPYGAAMSGGCDEHGAWIELRLTAGARDDGSAPKSASEVAGRRGTVLVIDDDRLVAGVLQKILASEHAVDIETAPVRALDRLLGPADYDAVLCDAMMPDLSGIELYERLLAARPEMAARVMFVSGGAYSDQGGAALASTGRPCLAKPFELERVRRVVREAVAARDKEPA